MWDFYNNKEERISFGQNGPKGALDSWSTSLVVSTPARPRSWPCTWLFTLLQQVLPEGFRQNLAGMRKQESTKEAATSHAAEYGLVFFFLLIYAMKGASLQAGLHHLPRVASNQTWRQTLCKASFTLQFRLYTGLCTPNLHYQIDNPSYSILLSFHLYFIKKKHAMDATYFCWLKKGF